MINIMSHAGKVDYNTKEFILDTLEDLEELKNSIGLTCDAGSTAFVIGPPTTVFMKNGKGEWVEI